MLYLATKKKAILKKINYCSVYSALAKSDMLGCYRAVVDCIPPTNGMTAQTHSTTGYSQATRAPPPRIYPCLHPPLGLSVSVVKP